LGDPDATEVYADYSQWEAAQTKRSDPKTPAKNRESSRSKPSLSYLEKKEYAEIEGKILKLEEKVRELNRLLESPEVAQDAPRLSGVCLEIGLAETQIEQLYLRWEELEKKTAPVIKNS
jgi:ATP-binding cassette subfamily F protein uup